MEPKDVKLFGYPSVITIILPGTFSVLPWGLFILMGNSAAREFMDKHEYMFWTLIIFLAVAAGLILEDISSRIEVIFDSIQPNRKENKKIWFKYLRTAFSIEPIGQRYLRSILMRMKFELSFGLSLISAIPGFVLVNHEGNVFSKGWVAFFVLLGLILVGYCFFEAYEGSKLLAKVRRKLVQKGVLVTPGK